MLNLKFNNVYINDYKCIVGDNERNGNLSGKIDVINDFYYGEKTFELSQIKMEKEVIDKLLKNNNLIDQNIDLVVGGDLTNQIAGTSCAVKNFNISFLGIYSACSSFIEGLIISSMFLQDENIKRVINITGSHNLVAERQFRYPVEYGAIRNVNSTFTSTGSVGCLLSNKKGIIKIKGAMIGSLFDYKISDPNFIGSIMAPACAEIIVDYLNQNNLDINYFDLILTGDLGNVGLNILKDYLLEEFNIKANNILDAGSNLYKTIEDINDGASGPSTLPLYFFYNILNKKKYKKILLVGTGSMHSSTMVNQKMSIPSISHLVSLEVI